MGQSRRPPTLVIDESGSAVHSLHFAPPVAAARAGQAVVVAGSKSTAPSTLPEKATIRSILADTGRAANLSADPPPRAGGEGALSQTATAIATADQSQSQSKPLKTSAAHQHQHQHLERERTSSPPQVQTQQPNRLSGRKRAVPDYAIASASSSSSSRPGSRNEGEGDGRAQATEGALPASTSSGSSPSGSYPVGIAPFNARHTSALESSSPDKNATEDQTQGQVHRSRNGNERRVMSENNDGYLGVGSQWRSRTRLDERGLETASGSASASGSRSGSSPTPAPRLAVESSRSDTGAELERKVGRDRKLRREADREKADREKDRDGDGEGEREGTKEGYQPAAAASWLLPSGVGVGVGVGVRPGSGIRTGIGIGVAERATGNEVSSSTDRSMGLALALPHSVSHSVGHSSSSSPCPLEVGAAAPAPAPGSARRAERSDAAESDDGLNPCCRALLDGALDRLRESFEARMQELHVDMLGAQRRQRVELAALLERYLLGGGAECGGGKEGDGEGAGGGAKEAVLELRRENARLRRVVGMSREARGF